MEDRLDVVAGLADQSLVADVAEDDLDSVGLIGR